MNHTETSNVNGGVAKQAILELDIIGHAREALTAVTQADFHETQLIRKLDALRFVLESFQRHVERLFTLEEQSGYIPALSESHPHLSSTIERLQRQHRGLTRSIQQLVTRVESISPSSSMEFAALCKDISRMTNEFVAHTHAETLLLQDAYDQDTGGES